MNDECDIRDGILVDTSPSGLNDLTEQALKLIQKHVFSNARRVNPSQAVTLSLSYQQTEYTISPAELVFEIEKIDFDKKIETDTTGYRGCYIREEGKIFLARGNWCIETIIHETLHACSRESESDELDKYYPFFEGLTELYTGFILFKEYQLCYQNCFRTNIGRLCQITYEELTKLWMAFCNFVPLNVTTALYFNNNSTWDKATKNFENTVNQLGFPNFRNPFSKGKLSTDLKFAIQCRRAFGTEFDEICESKNRYVDYTNVLQN